jgi:alkylated DNA repair dioxygenase AlkB
MVRPEVVFETGFVSDPERLFTRVRDDTAWDGRIRARLTASFGQPYNYSGISYPIAAWPAELDEVVDHLERRLGFRPNNCLANYYPAGDATMGFHSDSVAELAPRTGVAIVSPGAQRVLRFRQIADRSVVHDFPLPSGSLLYMPAEVQAEWKHAVPAQEGSGARISLTFRCLEIRAEGGGTA